MKEVMAAECLHTDNKPAKFDGKKSLMLILSFINIHDLVDLNNH
jgi:hypothetical protein